MLRSSWERWPFPEWKTHMPLPLFLPELSPVSLRGRGLRPPEPFVSLLDSAQLELTGQLGKQMWAQRWRWWALIISSYGLTIHRTKGRWSDALCVKFFSVERWVEPQKVKKRKNHPSTPVLNGWFGQRLSKNTHGRPKVKNRDTQGQTNVHMLHAHADTSRRDFVTTPHVTIFTPKWQHLSADEMWNKSINYRQICLSVKPQLRFQGHEKGV